ncbi:MAG: dTMP kinase [Thermotogota bacterium]
MEQIAHIRKGLFISLEGLDGCGKTTQIKTLRQAFQKEGKEVVEFREPGCTHLGEKLREIVLHSDSDIGERAELLIYLSSRAQVTDEIVIPALNEGKVVIADRYADSSVAYQGFGREIGAEKVKALNDFAIKKTYPDITFLLEISVEEALKRLENKCLDRLEKERGTFFQRVHQGYEWLYQKNPHRFVKISGELEPQAVSQRMLQVLVERGFLEAC